MTLVSELMLFLLLRIPRRITVVKFAVPKAMLAAVSQDFGPHVTFISGEIRMLQIDSGSLGHLFRIT